jgi:hypothetical protein
MTLHPEVQARARAELDAVVGQDRLPNCNDREHLPYIGALIKESVRWHCVAPSGRGFVIPFLLRLNFLILQARLIVSSRTISTRDTSYLKALWYLLTSGQTLR